MTIRSSPLRIRLSDSDVPGILAYFCTRLPGSPCELREGGFQAGALGNASILVDVGRGEILYTALAESLRSFCERLPVAVILERSQPLNHKLPRRKGVSCRCH